MADEQLHETTENSAEAQAVPDSGPGSGNSPADVPQPIELPERIRVHALAKLLGVTSKNLLERLGKLGADARSPQSSIDRAVAQSAAEAYGRPVAAPGEAPAPKTPAPKTPAPETPATQPPAEAGPAYGSLFASHAAAEAPAVAAEVPAEVPTPVFMAAAEPTPRKRKPKSVVQDAPAPEETKSVAEPVAEVPAEDKSDESDGDDSTDDAKSEGQGGGGNRRRRRGRRGRGRGRGEQQGENSDDSSGENSADEAEAAESADVATEGAPTADETTEDPTAENADESADDSDDSDKAGTTRRRRRRRRRTGTGEGSSDESGSDDDTVPTVVHEREPRPKTRSNRDEVQGISGSTRLEAKRQRRRDGREAGRRRPPILSEAEFLARREAVDRVMVVREKTYPGMPLTTQVAVLEDKILVEHFVTTASVPSMVGNVYLGKVQNVLPSMEAAFVDIGKGRNGVLYAGEVNWEAAGLGGRERKIEQALKPGDRVLVQVSKDPVGHKGARLTTQLSFAGRFLVYVPGGSSTGISRKLPDTERKRLKDILRDVLPEDAGVIIRTASEGVSAEELAGDVERLQRQWQSISDQVDAAGGDLPEDALRRAGPAGQGHS